MAPMPVRRRPILVPGLVLGLALALGAAAPTDGRSEDARPNIVLVLADDVGVECLRSYGGRSYETPRLDALAGSGTRFAHCYANPKCGPSRQALLTGRYAFRMGEERDLLPDSVTIGQRMRDAGYVTAMAGKWQMALLRDEPDHLRRYGFDESAVWGSREGPRYWSPLIYRDGKVMDGTARQFGPDLFAGFVSEFIERHAAERFFVYYAMVLAHPRVRGEPMTPPGRPGYETHAARIGQIDRIVGEIVDTLERLGLRERTLVLFTADNGSPAGAVSMVGEREVRGGKGDLSDPGTHVPLLASWPGTVPAGTVRQDLVDLTDFAPTLLELAGRDLDGQGLDGHSFVGALRGAPGEARTWTFAEWNGEYFTRDRRWKLYGDGRLFDMLVDPEERHPLPTDAEPSAEAARARLAGAAAGLLEGKEIRGR